MELVKKSNSIFLVYTQFLNDIGMSFYFVGFILWDLFLWSVSCNGFIAIMGGGEF
jgi:hypothetical protein